MYENIPSDYPAEVREILIRCQHNSTVVPATRQQIVYAIMLMNEALTKRCGKMGHEGMRRARLSVVEWLLGGTIETFNNLTVDQASAIIDGFSNPRVAQSFLACYENAIEIGVDKIVAWAAGNVNPGKTHLLSHLWTHSLDRRYARGFNQAVGGAGN